jgi:glycosyltransferase involved in cell wall biosynthesis
MQISVAMIVKNEQEMLARALESVKEADEKIVCDTGSTDSTIEIAKKYTDKIYTDFVWCDHFGKARQHSKDKCAGDWIMNLDGDEYLENDFSDVRKAVEEAEKMGAQFINVLVKSIKGSAHNWFPRIYKNIPEVKWKGAAHNYLELVKGEKKTYQSNIVQRYDYSPAHKLDPDRTLRILSKAVKKDPELVRERYYLAREYYYRKKYKECIRHLKAYLKRSQYKAERADAYWMMASSYWFSQQGNKARDACLQAIGINPNFREALVLMSEMYYEPNKSRWASFADLADNTGVLFIREVQKDFVVGKDIKLQKVEKTSEYYDQLFERDTDMSRYTEIYKEIGQLVGDSKVLDIGCGPAQLSKYITHYSGFDFAEKTVQKIKDLDVWVGNALDRENFKDADVYTLTEVLEHIEKDKEVLENIPSGKRVICSVPSFNDPSHLRVFTEQSFRERYGDILDIKNIIRFNLDNDWKKNIPDTSHFILLVDAIKK